MSPSHFEHANGTLWSRKMVFGRPLWQLTLVGSAVVAASVVPTVYNKWMNEYRSHHPLPHILPSTAAVSVPHPYVHADNLQVRLVDIPHHNVLVARLEKERQWIMFG